MGIDRIIIGKEDTCPISLLPIFRMLSFKKDGILFSPE
jgi:hypothetical protein